MSTSHTLLALLEREPAYGYTLKRDFDERFARTKPLAFGQVYAALARFERLGWADAVDVEAGDGPDRKRYRITSDGVETVSELGLHPRNSRRSSRWSNLYTRVKRGAHLRSLRRRGAGPTAGAAPGPDARPDPQQRKTAAPAEQLAITYELAHLDADLRWIEEAGTRLEERGAMTPVDLPSSSAVA